MCGCEIWPVTSREERRQGVSRTDAEESVCTYEIGIVKGLEKIIQLSTTYYQRNGIKASEFGGTCVTLCRHEKRLQKPGVYFTFFGDVTPACVVGRVSYVLKLRHRLSPVHSFLCSVYTASYSGRQWSLQSLPREPQVSQCHVFVRHRGTGARPVQPVARGLRVAGDTVLFCRLDI